MNSTPYSSGRSVSAISLVRAGTLYPIDPCVVSTWYRLCVHSIELPVTALCLLPGHGTFRVVRASFGNDSETLLGP